jgi:hypothetical protein
MHNSGIRLGGSRQGHTHLEEKKRIRPETYAAAVNRSGAANPRRGIVKDSIHLSTPAAAGQRRAPLHSTPLRQ